MRHDCSHIQRSVIQILVFAKFSDTRVVFAGFSDTRVVFAGFSDTCVVFAEFSHTRVVFAKGIGQLALIELAPTRIE